MQALRGYVRDSDAAALRDAARRRRRRARPDRPGAARAPSRSASRRRRSSRRGRASACSTRPPSSCASAARAAPDRARARRPARGRCTVAAAAAVPRPRARLDPPAAARRLPRRRPGSGKTARPRRSPRSPASRSTRRLSLGGLSESEVAEYVELTAAELASPQLATALHAKTDGNPLFVGEIVRLLSVEGASPAEPQLAIPQSVRDVIARRLTSRLAGVQPAPGARLGARPRVRARRARPPGGVADDAAARTLDEAIAARVVTDVPGAPGRLRFAHVLIRDTLYDGLTSARRATAAQARRRGARAPRRRAAGPHLAELAHHSLAGGDHGQGSPLRPPRRRPGARAARLRGGGAPVPAGARGARARAAGGPGRRAPSCSWRGGDALARPAASADAKADVPLGRRSRAERAAARAPRARRARLRRQLRLAAGRRRHAGSCRCSRRP